ncbi:MAG: 6-bladed beta-propeller [Candidatus Anammoxibacter sp.]
MTTIDKNIPCDLVMGFSFDMLLDLINCQCSDITIDSTSVDIISPSYKYAFLNYFKTEDDRVIAYLPHDVKVVDDEHFETIAWGTATLRGGMESRILKLAHHYCVKYIMPDSSDKKAAIQLDYDGTEISVVKGGKLDAIPERIIRQAIQTAIKRTAVPQILLEHPKIDIPFADVAVDLQRLTVNGNKKNTSSIDSLYFEVTIGNRKHMLGRFDVYGNSSVDLGLTCLLRNGNIPLSISVQGINPGAGDESTNLLGSASATHNLPDDDPLSSALVGKTPEAEWELYQDLINANVKYTYAKVQALTSPILECFGHKLKTCDEVSSMVSDKIYEPFMSLKPNYTLEYTIRRLDPVDIPATFLGLALNSTTNSFCLKFDYNINGIGKGSPAVTADSDFVYPYGLGITISENLLKKIYKAYRDLSCVLPTTFCSDYDKLIPSKGTGTVYSYSLNINSSELFIDSSKIQIVTSIKTIGNYSKSICVLKFDGANDTLVNKGVSFKSIGELKMALTETDFYISDSNKLNMDFGATEFGMSTNKLDEIRNLPDSIYNNLTDMYSGTKINLLDLPDEFTIGSNTLNLSYNHISINPNGIIIGSKVNKLRKLTARAKPALPPLKKGFDTNTLVPKDKWGYEGTAKGSFNLPCGLSISETKHGAYLYVADSDNNRVQMFGTNGKFVLQWGAKGSGDGQLNYPINLSVDSNGNVYVVDAGNNRVQKFAPDGSFVIEFGNKDEGKGVLLFPQGIVVGSTGNIYVTDSNHLVMMFDPHGKFIKEWGGKGDKNGKFCSPRGIAYDRKGFLYVVDAGNHRIQKFNEQGKFISTWGSKGTDDGMFYFPQGLAFDNDGNVYVTDTGNNRIQKFDSKGVYIAKVSGEGTSIGQFLAPYGIAIDKKGDIYVTDSFNNRVQKFGP